MSLFLSLPVCSRLVGRAYTDGRGGEGGVGEESNRRKSLVLYEILNILCVLPQLVIAK
jgi:hypothetical protein